MAPQTDRAVNGDVALLSIHPPYAQAILNGSKRVELRKASLRSTASHVVIYATSPVQRVVGMFSLDGIDAASPGDLWRRYRTVAGISPEDYDAYFEGRTVGYALRVGDVSVLDRPVGLEVVDPALRPPQNVVYLSQEAVDRLQALTSVERPAGTGALIVRPVWKLAGAAARGATSLARAAVGSLR